MSVQKADVVIEAVRYSPEGKIDLARAYLRRASAFSDRCLLDRNQLLDKLKAGQRVYAGQRMTSLGGCFNLDEKVHLVASPGGTEVITTSSDATQDNLMGTPLF